MGALDRRVAIVTGAGGGLGREHALRFAAEGADVLVNDVRDAQAVADEVVASGGRAVALEADAADMATGPRLVDVAIESFGDLHAVVNNAGFVRDALIVDMTEENFDAVLAVHLKGTFSLTQAAARYWRQQSKAGIEIDRAIVNTSSQAGLHGNVGQFNYSAAKAGIAIMTVNATLELKRYGVRTNCIAPAARTDPVLATPVVADLMVAPDDPEAFDRFDPANISPLVAYLSSAGCPFNGQVFSVFGGHVGMYGGWSIAETIDQDARWGVDDLAKAMASFPDRIKVNRQRLAPVEDKAS